MLRPTLPRVTNVVSTCCWSSLWSSRSSCGGSRDECLSPCPLCRHKCSDLPIFCFKFSLLTSHSSDCESLPSAYMRIW
ncbi:hypothetical protein EG68_08722 [Paragonimus skrjabini miyazakii]|uniref:Uncharacterized protein n=1 Tax=Paragonimus skrjabini miyazakii TaxID=59628 RepID=A0A8S9YK81_9TREM|nr:hypothetical protein EG68_08722 [Paragonimus skrjabini miyazakii]